MGLSFGMRPRFCLLVCFSMSKNSEFRIHSWRWGPRDAWSNFSRGSVACYITLFEFHWKLKLRPRLKASVSWCPLWDDVLMWERCFLQLALFIQEEEDDEDDYYGYGEEDDDDDDAMELDDQQEVLSDLSVHQRANRLVGLFTDRPPPQRPPKVRWGGWEMVNHTECVYIIKSLKCCSGEWKSDKYY